jgi:hypothetical protein
MQALKNAGLPATYTRLTADGAEIGVANAEGDALSNQLRAKGMTAEMGADGAVEVHF